MRFWQATAFLETQHALEIARVSEDCGYDGLTVSDHIFYARDQVTSYPYTPDGERFWTPETHWPDPWVLIAAMAAVTTRVQFTTNVYVAPARDLFTVAKLVSTAAVLSNGRVSLGAGPGWCAEEFAQTGQDFATRGKRFDEMVDALRLLWAGGMAEYHGVHYDFAPVSIAPVPAAPIPIYIGGDSEVALRRAARVGDGWMGNLYSEDAAFDIAGRMRKQLADAGRSTEGFDICLAVLARPTPDLFHRLEDAGVTSTIVAPWLTAKDQTPAGRVAAIETFAERVLQKM
jgi:probable F420-dependent oxidoreductase